MRLLFFPQILLRPDFFNSLCVPELKEGWLVNCPNMAWLSMISYLSDCQWGPYQWLCQHCGLVQTLRGRLKSRCFVLSLVQHLVKKGAVWDGPVIVHYWCDKMAFFGKKWLINSLFSGPHITHINVLHFRFVVPAKEGSKKKKETQVCVLSPCKLRCSLLVVRLTLVCREIPPKINTTTPWASSVCWPPCLRISMHDICPESQINLYQHHLK